MRDFIDILRAHDLYREEHHNMSNHEYQLNGNLVEFISLDQPQKIRGRKRNLLYINEANELFFEDWQQLIFRTDGKIILDYNPSDSFHWIYDKVLTRDDCDFYQTTYKDNPFLDAVIIDEIERLQFTDEDYWRVYGLGERGSNRAAVFTYSTSDLPQGAKLLAYGMDFGYTNDPTSLVGVYEYGDSLYMDELIYRTGMTNRDIHNVLTDLGISRYAEIFADSAEPKSIDELHRFGWNVKPTAKGPDSVMAGIDMMKRFRLLATPRSTNLIKELQNYKWAEDKNGNLLNKPMDAFNHCFVGDTLVTTMSGDVPIKDITEGDIVLTSRGYRTVICRFDNGFKQVNTYLMQFGTVVVYLTCTESHKIKTTNGWKQIKDLKKGDVLYLHKSLTGSNTTYIPMSDTSARVSSDFTESYGNTIMVKSLKGITFTTLMATLKTIPSRICNSLKRLNISVWRVNLGFKTKNGLSRSGGQELNQQKSGTQVKRALNFIKSSVKNLGNLVNINPSIASNAEKNLRPDTLELVSIAITTAKQKPYEQEERVYDIMVDDCHEYYANGVLVHNCMDAARYAVFNKKANPNFGRYSLR